MIRQNFTYDELEKAGPLFNPDHVLCQSAKVAWHCHQLVLRVERKRIELLAQVKDAHQDVRHTSTTLRLARCARNALSDTAYQAHVAADIRRCELAVLAAHDKAWAAQRALALWEATYA